MSTARVFIGRDRVVYVAIDDLVADLRRKAGYVRDAPRRTGDDCPDLLERVLTSEADSWQVNAAALLEADSEGWTRLT